MGVMFANVIAIYRRELQSYFQSPLAYIVAGVFWFLLSSLFMTILIRVSDQVSTLEFQRQVVTSNEVIDAPGWILDYFFSSVASVVLGILPLLSMNLYAEERKRGTLELLATSPITNWAVAVGKLAAVTTLFITLMVPIMGIEIIALSTSSPPISIGVFFLGHFGLVLMATAILAIGLCLSSLTDNAIVAAILTYAVVLLLFLIDLLGDRLPGILGELMTHLSLLKHFTTLSQGVFSVSSIILFSSYVVLGIFLTAQSIDLFRFQK